MIDQFEENELSKHIIYNLVAHTFKIEKKV